MKDVQQTHSKHLIYDIVEVFATYTWYGMLHKYQCLSKIPAKKNVFEELKKGEQEKSGQKIRVFCNNWNIMLDNFLSGKTVLWIISVAKYAVTVKSMGFT